MELINLGGSPAIPFDTAPVGTTLVCNIVIGMHKNGDYALEERLPSGVAFDHNNPAHIFGLFVVQNAQQLMALARQVASKEAEAIQQRDEVIARAKLGV
jgi:hypothetical protein